MKWRRSLRLAASVVICALLLTAPVSAQSSISREQELAAGRYAAARIMVEFPVIVDADWLNYLVSLRDTLAPFSGRSDIPHQIVIVDLDVPNAASTPGWLFFTTGLLKLGMDRHGWAFVVAHELAHTARRHVAIEIEKARAAALLNILVTVITGSPSTGDLVELLSRLAMLGHTRELELEADALGMRMMTEAGFEQEKAVATLRFFNEATGRREEKTHWAGTHPGFADRITRLEVDRQRLIEQGFPVGVTYYAREVQAGDVAVRVVRLVQTRRGWTIDLEVENKGGTAVTVNNTAIRMTLTDGQSIESAFLRSSLGSDILGGTAIKGAVVFDRPGASATPAVVVVPISLPGGSVDVTLSLQGGGPLPPKPQPSRLPRPPSLGGN